MGSVMHAVSDGFLVMIFAFPFTLAVMGFLVVAMMIAVFVVVRGDACGLPGGVVLLLEVLDVGGNGLHFVTLCFFWCGTDYV